MKKYRFPKYSANWNELAKRCKRRDNYKCVRCGERGKLNAHHIVSKSRGGQDKLFNLITLCEDCHALRHPHLRKKRG